VVPGGELVVETVAVTTASPPEVLGCLLDNLVRV
jgi:hypothetical protein